MTGTHPARPISELRFLVAGAYVLDCLISTPRLPAWGDDLRADAMRTVPGGKALNQAVTLAHLGAQVAAVGCVGTDVVGEAIRSALRAEGIDVSTMAAIPEAPTPVCVVYTRADGENAMVWRVPDALNVTAGHLITAVKTSGPGDALLVTFESPDQAAGIITAASDQGIRVILNPAPLPSDPAVIKAIPWEHVDMLVPNEAEARALLTGHSAAHGPAEHLADAVADALGVRTVCATLAEHGCVLRIDGSTNAYPAPPADVIDVTGASDAFTAVLCAHLIAGTSPADAVHQAQAAAALTISRPGAYEALPTATELHQQAMGLPNCSI
ncbi:PfkB family carbohydrate kinase [Candidatus Protofrankia datiscae]|uniref:Ribokinase n=1 Tax=Candidatus Protofrankia datiscae TaxID=2716812 RepID=F8B0V0_9ACTN|nr:PfkB family carbohydrate kinase [Candidatus Protofrankia datiscae]AEH07655.1 Ribokinase [Candidatus Protofrankia datiscae]